MMLMHSEPPGASTVHLPDRAVVVLDVHHQHRGDDQIERIGRDAVERTRVRRQVVDREARSGRARAHDLDQPRAAVNPGDARAAAGQRA